MPLTALTSPTLLWVMLICSSLQPSVAIVASDYGPPIEEMTSSDGPVDGMRGKHLLVIPWPVVNLIFHLLIQIGK